MAEATEKATTKVKSIFIYPVKSCRGISVSQAQLTSNGLRWDRLWLVVNSKGRMYTQRVAPKLALIQVELPVEAFSPGWEPNKTSFLVIRAPGINELKIPLVEPHSVANGVSVWEWSGSAFDEGEEAAKWFSDYLGKPSRLVRFNEASELRPVNSDYARSHSVKFNDLYPFLMLSQESLDALNDRLPEPVSVNRFRPNLVVDGCEPFAEDLWDEIKINDLTFHGGELCYRCKIPTVNQETGEVGSEPTATLTTFRSDKILRPDKEKHQGRVYIGQLLVCTNYTPETGKVIRVGDPVRVLKTFSSYAECLI
ncbi:hypothetical protein ACJIZ3_007792 [Penstemon smallii]|uniref:MOSC domain-containing protein n=1 Tax=Penstemon smallii TaxID=265156 RepID=A0ABD3T8Y2_9LAMI